MLFQVFYELIEEVRNNCLQLKKRMKNDKNKIKVIDLKLQEIDKNNQSAFVDCLFGVFEESESFFLRNVRIYLVFFEGCKSLFGVF